MAAADPIIRIRESELKALIQQHLQPVLDSLDDIDIRKMTRNMRRLQLLANRTRRGSTEELRLRKFFEELDQEIEKEDQEIRDREARAREDR